MEPLEPLDGGWLAAPGKYQDLVRDLCASDPRLRQPEKLPFLRWAHRQARVIVFELHEYSDARVPRVFTDMRELDEELKKRGKGPNERPEKMLYIVENANQSLVDIMGRHFELHPSMFLEYARTTQTPRYNKGHSSLLASALATRDYLWFNYYELVLLPDELQGNSYRLRCSETGRSVRTTRVRGVFDRAGLAFHKCFFWSKPRASGSGWDCIVICDPPVQTVRISGDGPSDRKLFPLPRSGLDGYVDFIPGQVQTRTRRGPPRTGIADDLAFYIATHGNLVGIDSPDTIAMFIKKIVASHYTRQFDFFRRNLREVQRFMRQPSDFSKVDLASVEANWSDIQTIERRLDKARCDLEHILIQIGASLDPPHLDRITSWQDTSSDFRFLYHRFIYLQQSAEQINSSITGLAGIVGNRQAFKDQQLSLHAAEKSRGLTFIGLVFIPLAFVSSLFSMSEPYGPGGDRFWLYFAISVPVALGVIMAYYIFDLGYRSDGSGWSASQLLESGKGMARGLVPKSAKRAL